jgi:lipoate-protein ligase A
VSESAGSWRLIRDDHHDGAWNMAVDEAILEAYESAPSPREPTLRIYGWRPAAISLGKSQPIAETHDPAALLADGVDLVRRPTGGEAVLHEHERTYAVVAAGGVEPFSGGPVDAYRKVALALVSALGHLGVGARAEEPSADRGRSRGAVCFQRLGAWEIAVSGRKLIGSSQFRRRRAFLQHGSIPIRLDATRLAALTGAPVDPSRFIDLTAAAGRAVGSEEIDAALVAGFEEVFGVRLAAGALRDDEALRAAELRCWKYDSVAWTREGTIGVRERHWGPALAR